MTDDEILAAYKALARDGVFCEPASAASVAGLKKYAAQQEAFAQSDATVVCVLTGHGLKDPERAIALAPKPKSVAPTVEAIRGELGL